MGAGNIEGNYLPGPNAPPLTIKTLAAKIVCNGKIVDIFNL